MLYICLAVVDLILSARIMPPFAPCYEYALAVEKNLKWKSGLDH